jgi:serine/threonine protein kinase
MRQGPDGLCLPVDVDVVGTRTSAASRPVLNDGWELRVASGRGAGSVLVIPPNGAVLGSSRECDLVLHDEGVAPRHLRLSLQADGGLGFTHLGGGWPTLVDGEARSSGALPEGSQVQVGVVVLSVLRRSVTASPGVSAPEEDEAPLAPGTLIADRYRIDGVVGRGGMGTVYRAEHLALARPVALKVLRAAHGARTDFVQRFQREAVAASHIRHPGIVEVTDFGRTPEGRFYLAMEFIEGETLARRLARTGPLPVPEAVRRVRDIAEALGAAHARGIYHRDIKPENVLLGPEERVKVVDFGIARLVEGPRDARETAAGLIFGTPNYMSPEQAAGQRQDGRSDIYALGVLLYELLTGAPPFLGASATHVLAAHLLTPAPRLPADRADGPIPPALADLVSQMMAKAPADRPASMDQVVAALDAVVAGQPLPPLRRTIRKRWTWAIAGGLLLCTALAVLALRASTPTAPSPNSVPTASPQPPSPAASAPSSTPKSSPPAEAAGSQAPALAPPAEPARPARVRVGVVSNPPGARVSLHGRVLGRTPLSIALPTGVPTLLVFESEGRLSIAQRVQPRKGLVVSVQLPPAGHTPTLDDLKASPY